MGAKTIGDVLALPANGKLGGVVCDDDLDGWLDDGCTDWLVVVAGVAATTPTVSEEDFGEDFVFLWRFCSDCVEGPDWPSLLDELVYPFVTIEVFTETCFDGLTFTMAAGFAVSSSSISKLL